MANSSNEFQLPWVEKYRPILLSDIVGNPESVSRLKAIAKNGNMPNLLVTGPPGIGKTTSIHCLAREMLGEELYKQAVLELNASDDRGIETVRNNIKLFAQQKVTLPQGRHKIIILDEADNMTEPAQQALRRTMELYTHNTRFALACNQSNKVIEPIQSRTSVLRFSRLSDKEVLKRIMEIISLENVPYDEGGLEALLFTADGDLRQAINNLQATHAGFGFLSKENVFKICDQPHPAIIDQILDHCIKKDVHNACRLLGQLWHQGYSCYDIIGTLQKVTRNKSNLEETKKLLFLKEIGITHMKVANGLTTQLQLSGLLARLCMVPDQIVSSKLK